MKIVLSAPPGTGKSTIVHRVTAMFSKEDILGVWGRENLNNGKRVGFSAVRNDGEERIFMSEGSFDTLNERTMVGKYVVDVDVIDNFIVQELNQYLEETEKIIYVDEIGRAQALSSAFLTAIQLLFDTPNITLLSTIVSADEEWSLPFKTHSNSWLINVTPDNRDELVEIVYTMLCYAKTYENLPALQRNHMKKLFFTLLDNNEYIAARKLFANTVRYLIEGRVEKIGVKCQRKMQEGHRAWITPSIEEKEKRSAELAPIEMYSVRGDSGSHKVERVVYRSGERDESSHCNEHTTEYSCDCPLWNGTGKFFGKSQTCSHILAVEVLFNPPGH